MWCTSEPQQPSPLGTTTSTLRLLARRRFVDTGIEHRLGAAGEDGDATALLAFRRPFTRPGGSGNDGDGGGSKIEHGLQWLQCRKLREQPGKGSRDPCQMQGQAEATGIGQNRSQKIAGQAIHEGAFIGLFDMGAGMIDKMHVVHAGGTGGGAGKAREAAVDMGNDLPVGRAAVFQHVPVSYTHLTLPTICSV